MYMQYITTTQLRTKSSELVQSLKKGGHISLIHRSKIIGKIHPLPEMAKPFNAKEFRHLTKSLSLPKTNLNQRKKIYNKQLTQKYGKNIS